MVTRCTPSSRTRTATWPPVRGSARSAAPGTCAWPLRPRAPRRQAPARAAAAGRRCDCGGARRLVLRAAEPVQPVAQLGRVLDDLREAHDRDRVLHAHLAPVDLLEE